MRVFLAITPDPATRQAIDTWRIRCWPTIAKPVPAQNYHITLAFLGDVAGPSLDKLGAILDSWREQRFHITLDDVGFWSSSRCLWLGPSAPSISLTRLAAGAATAANRIGVKVRKKSYTPHLTLARGVKIPPSAALQAPDFSFEVSGIELYQSILDSAGARYIELAHWELESSPRPRD